MLLGNYTILNKNPNRLLVGTQYRSASERQIPLHSFYTSEADGGRLQHACLPTGTEPPYVWRFAPKGGELSATTYVTGSGSLAGSLLSGRYMEADLSGTASLSASMSLITSLVAALTGSGELSANLKTTLSLAADLAGSGDISGSLGLLIELLADLSGSGSLTADLKGNLDLQANIYVNQSEATVQQIVDAVWNALASDYNTSGTMGNKLNGAGSAGDPWTTDLSTYNTTGTAGKIVKQIKSLAQAGL